jgi:hypothetical protein
MPWMVQYFTDHRGRVFSGPLTCRAVFANCGPHFFERADPIRRHSSCIGDVAHSFSSPSEFFMTPPPANPQQDAPLSFIIRPQPELHPVFWQYRSIILNITAKLSGMPLIICAHSPCFVLSVSKQIVAHLTFGLWPFGSDSIFPIGRKQPAKGYNYSSLIIERDLNRSHYSGKLRVTSSK